MIPKFGPGHASRGPLSNLPSVTTSAKLPERRKKDKMSVLNVEIFEAVMQNFGWCRIVEMVEMVTHHTRCRFEGKNPVPSMKMWITMHALTHASGDGHHPIRKRQLWSYLLHQLLFLISYSISDMLT
jgi:hypothetical protein